MSNWDLMMPGMGLTSIGLAGVVLAYAEIAHTFIDGMHALAGLTMFIGLIILAVGILDGGVSTSNRAKATVLTVLSIALGFGAYAFTFNTVSTSATFAGILMAIAAPATIIAYISMKHSKFVKPVAMIFILGSVAGIAAFVGFGLVGPAPYLVPDEAAAAAGGGEDAEGGGGGDEIEDAVRPGQPAYTVAMLEGSIERGAPYYDPDVATVERGRAVVWVNEDSLPHTATSEADAGETFDTGLVGPGERYSLDTSGLDAGEYPYFCLIHPYMTSVLVVEGGPGDGGSGEGGGDGPAASVSIPDGGAVIEPGRIYYDPEDVTVRAGEAVSWTNDDTVAHTVTSGNREVWITGVFDSGLMPAGAAYTNVFAEEGEYDYFCTLHPWMEGTVAVVG